MRINACSYTNRSTPTPLDISARFIEHHPVKRVQHRWWREKLSNLTLITSWENSFRHNTSSMYEGLMDVQHFWNPPSCWPYEGSNEADRPLFTEYRCVKFPGKAKECYDDKQLKTLYPSGHYIIQPFEQTLGILLKNIYKSGSHGGGGSKKKKRSLNWNGESIKLDQYCPSEEGKEKRWPKEREGSYS